MPGPTFAEGAAAASRRRAVPPFAAVVRRRRSAVGFVRPPYLPPMPSPLPPLRLSPPFPPRAAAGAVAVRPPPSRLAVAAVAFASRSRCVRWPSADDPARWRMEGGEPMERARGRGRRRRQVYPRRRCHRELPAPTIPPRSPERGRGRGPFRPPPPQGSPPHGGGWTGWRGRGGGEGVHPTPPGGGRRYYFLRGPQSFPRPSAVFSPSATGRKRCDWCFEGREARKPLPALAENNVHTVALFVPLGVVRFLLMEGVKLRKPLPALAETVVPCRFSFFVRNGNSVPIPGGGTTENPLFYWENLVFCRVKVCGCGWDSRKKGEWGMVGA